MVALAECTSAGTQDVKQEESVNEVVSPPPSSAPPPPPPPPKLPTASGNSTPSITWMVKYFKLNLT